MFTENEIEQFMQLAIQQAQIAFDQQEVPIGAILVDKKTKEVVAKNHNQKETTQKSTAHAELLVIQEANHKLKNWRLENYALFTTVEPCLMCAGAIIQSRISELFYGIADPKFGAVESLYQTLADQRANHQVTIHSGILEDQSKQLIQDFFVNLRLEK